MDGVSRIARFMTRWPDRLSLQIGARAAASRFLRSSFVANFSLRAAALALGLVVNVALARLLGPAQFGVYVFALTTMTLVAVPLYSGMATLLIREVARDAAVQAWGRVRGELRAVNLAVLVVATLAVVIAALSVWWRGAPQNPLLWLSAILLLPLYCLASLRGAVLRGLQRPILGQFPDLIVRPAVLVLVILLAHQLIPITAAHAMALHVVAAFSAVLVGTVLLNRLLPRQVRVATPEYRAGAWLRGLLPFTLIAGIQVANSSIAVLMLGKFGTLPTIGLYRVADLGASLVVMGLVAGDIVFAPRIAAMYALGDCVALQRQVTRMTQAIFLAALPMATMTMVFGAPLIRFLFGDAFAGARWPLFVLSLGQLVNASTGSVGSLLTMTGHEREPMRAVAITTLMNLLLCAWLIPHLGILGAAYASSASLVALNLFLQLRVRQLIGIRSRPW